MSIKKYLEPLWLFISLEVLFLVALLLWPVLAAQEVQVAADAEPYLSTFWGLAWATGAGMIRGVAYLAFQAAILWVVVKSFLGLRG